MKLQTKLFFVCTIPTIALILTIAASVWSTQSNRTQLQRATQAAVFSDLARTMQLQVREIHEMLNALSATRKADEVKEVFVFVGKIRDVFHKNVGKFRAHYTAQSDQKRLDQLKAIDADIDALIAAGQSMTLAYVQQGTAEGTALMNSVDDISDRLQTSFETFVEEQVGQFTTVVAGVTATGSKLSKIALGGGVIVVGLVVFVTLLAAKSIARPIFAALETIREAGEQVATTTAHVSRAGNSLAGGAAEQAAAIEATADAIGEMSGMTKRNAAHAQQAKEAAITARQSADAGSARMAVMQSAMNDIAVASRDITKILKTIDEIAFQTNILAFNASIEAGHAGEAGLGFAVVAAEIRALAQRSAIAARETAAKIEDSVKKSQYGAAISAEVSQTFATIQEQIRTVDRLVNDIAVASREQSEGITQVNTSVTEMDKIIQSNAATAQESAASAQESAASAQESAASAVELNAEAEKLTAIVGALFRLIGGRRHCDNDGMSGTPRAGGRRKIDLPATAAGATSPAPDEAPHPCHPFRPAPGISAPCSIFSRVS